MSTHHSVTCTLLHTASIKGYVCELPSFDIAECVVSDKYDAATLCDERTPLKYMFLSNRHVLDTGRQYMYEAICIWVSILIGIAYTLK